MKYLHKKSLTAFIMIILVLFTLVSCGNKKTDTSKKTATGSIPKLLDLGAKSCVPCKMMEPILDELREEYKGIMDVVFIDVWQPENRQEAVKHGIKAIPTQIFFDEDGNELWRHTGFISKEDILNKWKELGYDLKPKKHAVILDDCADCPQSYQLASGCSCQ